MPSLFLKEMTDITFNANVVILQYLNYNIVIRISSSYLVWISFKTTLFLPVTLENYFIIKKKTQNAEQRFMDISATC